MNTGDISKCLSTLCFVKKKITSKTRIAFSSIMYPLCFLNALRELKHGHEGVG